MDVRETPTLGPTGGKGPPHPVANAILNMRIAKGQTVEVYCDVAPCRADKAMFW